MVAVLRFLHIIAGIVWAGGAIMMNLVIGPAIAATGDSGRQFAGHLMTKTPLSNILMGSGILTVLAGGALYGINSNWFSSAWMMSGQGIGFGIGAIAGILALGFGSMTGRTNGEMAALGAQIQGKPTEAQMTAMAALRKRQSFVGKGNLICMIISIVLMASARFFG